jgi:hypothetical protein
MRPMTTAEWLKYDWRIEVFLRKYKAGESFEMVNGSKQTFIYDKSVESMMESRNKSKIDLVQLIDANGNNYKVSAIGKSIEFGGRGTGSGTAKEDIELGRLRNMLNEIKAREATSIVKIKIGTKIYDVFDAESTPGTPKSDFHLLDINGNEIVWISHKDGKTPKDFQQWGGISLRNEPRVYRHPEVQNFIEDLKDKYPKGLPNATSLYRKIKDNSLKMMSVYGNEFDTKKLSRQNVSILIQGPVKLKKTNGVYEFESNHIHFNGEKITGGFEPVLAAIYKGDRSDAGVKGTRIVIMSIDGRKMTGEI